MLNADSMSVVLSADLMSADRPDCCRASPGLLSLAYGDVRGRPRTVRPAQRKFWDAGETAVSCRHATDNNPADRRTTSPRSTAARSLVDCEPWPDDDATTGADAAKLALLRLLWLQRQTRSAARHRNGEATVLLARSLVEACILGLYCLHKPDAIPRLKAANIKAMGSMPLDFGATSAQRPVVGRTQPDNPGAAHGGLPAGPCARRGRSR
jgi:hypothetical protein